MSNRLSHSQINTFLTCGQKYKYHYIDKLRERVTSSALVFGSAIDEALNMALNDKKDGQPENWNKYLERFTEYWTNGYINKKREHLPKNPKLVYAQSDIDWDLIDEESMEELAKLSGSETPQELHKSIRDQKAIIGWEKLKSDRKEFYNYANWLSLHQKGVLMLEAYRRDIFPRIKEVLHVQTKLDFDNEEGDSILGYLDTVVKWEDDTVLVVDNKTSARSYDADSVRTSPQLGLYQHFMKTLHGDKIKAAYFVMMKTMKKDRVKTCVDCSYDGGNSRAKSCDNEINGKRCKGDWDVITVSSAEIQIVIDEISERVEQMVVENFDDANKLIKTGIFTKNFNSCKGKFGLCPYYNLCWNDSKDGLDVSE